MSGNEEQGFPVQGPIFGHPTQFEPLPETVHMTIDGKTFGMTKGFITARSTYFRDVFETSNSCEFPFDDAVKWPTLVAYLNLLTVNHIEPILYDPHLRWRALPPSNEFQYPGDDLREPVMGAIVRARAACYFNFVPLATYEQRLARLRIVARFEEQDFDAGGFPLQDFYELVKLFHFCHLMGSPAAAAKVEQIFLRYLECLTTADTSEEMLWRVSYCQAEWFLLGNFRVSGSVKGMYLARFGEEEQQEILERWKTIRYGVSPV